MSEITPATEVPAGWYTDPNGAAQDRYWDGRAWTEHVRPVAGRRMAPAYAPPPPVAAAPPVATTGNGFSIAGIVFGILAFLILPILFGPIGLILGAVGKSKGESKATTAMVVAGVGMVVGMAIGALVALAML
jgi:hypothetical protein